MKLILFQDVSSTASLSIFTVIFSIIYGTSKKTFIFTSSKGFRSEFSSCSIKCFDSEIELFESFIDVILSEDPDVLVGFETDNMSWGFMSKKFALINESTENTTEFASKISRMKNNNTYLKLDP